MKAMRSMLCELLGVEVPIVLAPFGPWDEVELAAEGSRAGGLGSVGTAVRSVGELQEQWRRLRELTDRPFAINHTERPLNARRSTRPSASVGRPSRSTWAFLPT